MNIHIINGPNLNLLGTREPEIYGIQSFEAYLDSLKILFAKVTISYFQSNSEGEIVDNIQQSDSTVVDGIILNAGGYTHTSAAIGDTVASIKTPVVEVHISNVFSREEFRHKSFISKYSKGVIVGFGLDSYRLAIESFLSN